MLYLATMYGTLDALRFLVQEGKQHSYVASVVSGDPIRLSSAHDIVMCVGCHVGGLSLSAPVRVGRRMDGQWRWSEVRTHASLCTR